MRLDQKSLEKLLDDQPEIFNERERRKINRRRRKKPKERPPATKIKTQARKVGRTVVFKNGEYVGETRPTILRRY